MTAAERRLQRLEQRVEEIERLLAAPQDQPQDQLRAAHEDFVRRVKERQR